jgi:hypothetical protein
MILSGNKLPLKKGAGFKLGKWIQLEEKEYFMFNG